MAAPGDNQYVSTTSDLSNVREFVAGFQARNAQSVRNNLKVAAAGVIASALISAGTKAKAPRKHRR